MCALTDLTEKIGDCEQSAFFAMERESLRTKFRTSFVDNGQPSLTYLFVNQSRKSLKNILKTQNSNSSKTSFKRTETDLKAFVATIKNNIATMLQHCDALKIVVANRLV